ncbi:MAG: DUF4242 domain-containing protein [Thermoanaerobaculia bacterium]
MTLLIVETTYDPPLSDEKRRLDQDRLNPCLELREVAWVRSYESADRRRKVCLFRAPDADALREALHGAGIGFDRIWVADLREPDPDDPAGERVIVRR